ncbi:NADPH:quinone reductase [Candidatus Binatia bacterium]|nr:NADPH:quinone reductase [Candidatus Binatia bacterium]
MKAIRVAAHGGPEVLDYVDLADPQAGPGQVVVRVHAAGVNPVDTYIRAGTQGYGAPLPYTPGLDAAGVVESVGSGVTRWRAGDRVFTAGTLSGAYAERAVCVERQVHPLPDGVGFAAGAALGIPYGTAYRALFQRARVLPGETVLIHGGSGGVGIAAIQMARAHGCRVVATAGTDRGRELAREQGAHHAFDHGSEGYLGAVLAATGGHGVDAVLEMLANANLGKDLEVLAPRGRVVVIGSRGSVEINPRELMRRDADVRGMSLLVAPEHDLLAAYAGIAAGLEAGVLRPIVGRELPLAEAAAAHRLVMEPGAFGKIVLGC